MGVKEKYYLYYYRFCMCHVPITYHDISPSFPLFIVMMAIWSMLSWAISPVQQNYLIEIAPESAGIQQSLNNSALHLGIAFGSTVGGAVIKTSSVIYNAWIGAGFIILALLCAVFSITRKQFFTAEKKESIA